ncbi:MAG TPA: hypothetical protein VK507_04020 [Iamia sp.]|nr:hypothetical protein [Iamia sp.]
MTTAVVPVPEPTAPIVDEIAGAARLAGALVDTLTGPIQETHRGLAGRVFGVLGPVGAPVRIVHDAVAGVAYGTVRGGGRLAGAAAGAALAIPARGRDRRPISAHPLGAQALAFGSGLLGDWMDGRTDDLVVRWACTQHGRPLPADPAVLGAALDDPTDRLVVLVHGLAETTAAWGWWSEDDAGEHVPTYAERLCDVGWTPLEVGYNTGLPVDRSGAELADLVGDLVAAWPVPVREVALIGHSMGGLVAAAACHHALAGDAPWTELVSHVVSLGTPHAGSWLARGAHTLSTAAARLPETRGLATFLDLRSPGIRDLTRGWRPSALDPIAETAVAETAVADAETAAEAEIVTLAALLPHAQHAFVAASLGTRRRHPLTWLVGDGLVHPRSATAPARAARSAPNVVTRHHPGVGHLRLVHHPAVADDLVQWLTPRR